MTGGMPYAPLNRYPRPLTIQFFPQQKYRLEVGIQAMEHLIHVLQTDRSDSEIIGYALDTLYNVISNDLEEEEQANNVEQAGAASLSLL
ncbi:hypothetical protein llap_20068 [Limosa lapponica baueri]|uniref:Uncharacterized protein n=1 Tax=Limosa lapponica baueri TaxID=1758121 RepID=A0A2I0T783_LIMLA|nr:hypothetical protein llap_20068 [Limosa lapponica baueri]